MQGVKDKWVPLSGPRLATSAWSGGGQTDRVVEEVPALDPGGQGQPPKGRGVNSQDEVSLSS